MTTTVPTTPKKLIYIIDDDTIYVYTLKYLITSKCPECNVLTFKNGKEAYDKLSNLNINTEIPNYIFVDINMPIMNGWEFLDNSKLLQLNNDIKYFILSGSVDNEDVIKASTYSQVKKYLSKPVSPEVVLEVLEIA